MYTEIIKSLHLAVLVVLAVLLRAIFHYLSLTVNNFLITQPVDWSSLFESNILQSSAVIFSACLTDIIDVP